MMERLRGSRLVYVVLSVLVALTFWVYVRGVENPNQDGTIYGVPIQITNERVLEERGLTVASLSQKTTNVRVNAPISVLNNLDRNNITVSVDVTSCTEAGEYDLTVVLSLPKNINVSGAYFSEQNLETVKVTIDTLLTKTMNVETKLEGSVADGYQAGTPVVDPAVVEISGTPDQVNAVKRAAAILSVEDLDQSFEGTVPLTLLDEDGNDITASGVKLSQDSVYVTMTVGVVKEVKLTVNLVSGGGATESDAVCTIEPSTVTVVGSQDELDGLTEISLGSIDLSQVIGTATITKPIELSPTLESADGVTEAEVTVSVEGLATKSFNVTNIETSSNPPDGYTINVVTTERTVVVRGSESALENLEVGQIRIVADVSDVTATGTYPVPATVYLNASGEVGAIGSYTINVNVQKQ